ncbi:hypothetical protein P7C73_g1532, partial [Tremellales sp. Uapishka_1]
MEHYLFQDRDLDTQLAVSTAYMVLGNGMACAWATTRNRLYYTVIDVIHSWYTNQTTMNHLIVPPEDIERADRSPEARLDYDTPAFRGKKGLALFGHVRALFKHEQMQKLVIAQPGLFGRIVAFINMFVGLQPQGREQVTHAEFEIDWPRSFSILGEMAKLCRELGYAFRLATPEQLVSSLSSISNRILLDIMLMSNTLDPDRYTRPSEHDVVDVLVPGSKHTLIKQNMSRVEAFSFHHYLHYLFAEMMKGTKRCFLLDEDEFTFKMAIDQYVFRNPPPGDLERMKLMLIEYPMQKHVVLSQIRIGHWLKNGSSMRSQYHHYREINIRECTIDQEFFLLQFGLCVIDQFKFIVALIDRYGLANFFRGDVTDPKVWNSQMEPHLKVAMLEDFLLLVVHLVADTASVNDWSLERITRTHVIQQLALHALTYSELVKKIPDRCVEKGTLASILGEVADHREPTDTAPGNYSLKPECYSEIDVYWRHYSRNESRDVIDKLVARQKKLDPTIKNPVVLPRPLEIPPSNLPFHDLPNFLGTAVAHNLVFYVLAHCMVMADPSQWSGLKLLAMAEEGAPKSGAMPQMDVVLDLGLHIALLALAFAPKEFAEASVEVAEGSGSMSTFQNLWYMQTNPAYVSHKPRIDYILERVVEYLPEEYTIDYRKQRDADSTVMSPGTTALNAKEAAAARQKQIMAAFAQRQQDFAAMMEDEDEDEFLETQPTDASPSFGACIVCQDEVTLKKPGGMLALIQPSRVLREMVPEKDWLEEILTTPTSLDRPTHTHRFGMGTSGEAVSTDAYPAPYMRFGIYTSACNHLMHETCMSNYFDATRLRHTHQVQRHHPENCMRMEYLCPLCKSLGNVLVPLNVTASPLKPPNHTSSKIQPGRPPTLSEKIRSVSEEGLMKVSDSARIWDHHNETGELSPWFSDCNLIQHSLDPTYRRQMRAGHRMIERIRGMIKPLADQSQRIRQRKAPMYLPDDMVGYTVAMCEITQRGLQSVGATVAEQVPETSLRLIKKLIGTLQLDLDLFFGLRFDRTTLRVGLFARFLPDWYRASVLRTPLLLRQPLGIVIEAAALAPDLLHSVMVMAYFAELTRCMLGIAILIKRCLSTRMTLLPKEIDEDEQDALTVFSKFRPLLLMVLRNAGPFTDTVGVLNMITDDMLSKILYVFTLPFLRRCAIVYYAVAGTYPAPAVSEGCEYNRLLTILAIPRPKETLSNPQSTETPIVARWLTQWAMQGRVVPNLEFPGTYELARLPSRFEDLVLKTIDRRCDKCNSRPSFPAICLFCGKFLCLAGDCCSEGEQGECNLHMRECGAVVGIFIDIKRWMLLYLYAGSGSFNPMPFLDVYGELDPSLRRGHRQYIHEGRWEEIRRAVWLQHTIPTLTARRLELTTDGGGWGSLPPSPTLAKSTFLLAPPKPDAPPPSPSPSVASRISGWGRRPKIKGKGKGKDEDLYAENERPSTPLQDRRSRSPTQSTVPDSPFSTLTRRSSRLFTSLTPAPAAPPLPPLAFSSLEDRKEVRRKKVASAEFTKEGGILGRLGFEDPVPDTGEKDISLLATTEVPPEVGVEVPAPAQETIYPDSVDPELSSETQLAETVSPGSMEVLESADKSKKFWKGKGKARRASIALSENGDEVRSGSPTPRKPAAPVEPLVVGVPYSKTPVESPSPSQPPPSRPTGQLRRPSSSLFHNPFHRSSSRVSLTQNDSALDDGSFQLKGFRHVSGISDVEGSGGLEGYLAHTKRESTLHTNKLPPPRSLTPDILSPTPQVASSSDSPFSRPPISRPPSVAASLASVDGFINNSSRVSVALFRKGIRRPSEGPMSDPGHGGSASDDDVPLGLLKSFQPEVSREGSPIPLPLEDDKEKEKEHERRNEPPSPAVGVQVQRHTRGTGQNGSGGSGFVVKSGRTTRGSMGSESIARPVSRSSRSPDGQRNVLEDREVMTSPISSVADSYFPPQPQTIPTPLSSLKSKPDFGEGAFPSPLPTSQAVNFRSRTSSPKPISSSPHTAPPPRSLHLPTPPEVLHLPLPPDQMPDTPPRAPVPLSSLPSRPRISTATSDSPSDLTSPVSARGLSLLDEPLKLISTFWGSTQQAQHEPADEEFDPAFIAVSVPSTATDDESKSPPPAADTASPLTLDSRKTLQARLSNIAMASSTPHPRLVQPLRTKTLSSDSGSAATASPVATNTGAVTPATAAATTPTTSTTSTMVTSVFRPPSSFARAGVRADRKGWTSSEDDNEPTPRKTSIRTVPVGPRNISTQKGKRATATRSAKENSDTDSGSSSSSEDEPLKTVQMRASRSSLALSNKSSPMAFKIVPLPASPPSPPSRRLENEVPLVSPVRTRPHQPIPPPSRSHQLALQMQRPPALPSSKSQQLAPQAQQQSSLPPSRSQQLPPSESQIQPTARSPPSNQKQPPAMSPPRMQSQQPSLSPPRSKTDSPASSRSGNTGDSLLQLPITPKEMWQGGHTREGSEEDAWRYQERMRTTSQPQPPPQWNGIQPQMQMQMDMNMHRHMMKQQWQAQFMAAAYRASEEEWERASSTGSSSAHPQMPMYPMVYPVQQINPFSQQQMPYMYPYNPYQQSQVLPHLHPQQTGMYSYGPASHSVFGGEFGPPAQLKSHSQNVYDDSSRSVTGVAGSSRHQRDPSGGSISPPPSSWRKSGDWRQQSQSQQDDLATPRPARIRSSSTQYAN